MKLFGNRRRAAHTKKSALSRGTRTALIAAVKEAGYEAK